MTLEKQAQGHTVLFSYEAWGHVRPLCVLATHIVKTRPIYVTFLTCSRLLDRIETEISRCFSVGDKARSLIRVIAIPLEDETVFYDMRAMEKAFPAAYATLVREEPLKCAKTGQTYSAIPRPNSAILDFFCNNPLKTIRELSKSAVKVYDWYAGSATFLFYPFGPANKGGRGDFRPKILEVVEKTGRPLPEVAEEIMFGIKNDVVQIPGLPCMYDYEHQPQEMIFPPVAGALWMEAQGVLDDCDGIILSSPECYEPQAIAAIQEWFAESSKPAFTIGPLLPFNNNLTTTASEGQLSANAKGVLDFMEATLQSQGQNSMLYISFGSMFWSTEPEKIWAFLDVVMDRKIPFIMSHASPFAVVPEEVKEKVSAYGLGLLCPWSPQQTILSHPVTGWFVTHGGQNSVIEAIAAGVPMICWPFHADQPLNAIHLSHNLEVAYELIEVRNGKGLKPILRNGRVPVGTIEAVRKEANEILGDAFLADGERKRANMKALREATLGCWKEGGSATLSMKALTDALAA